VKSRTPEAMRELTNTIRQHIPFDEMNEARLCSGLCIGCPKKMLEYIEQEVEYWERNLDNCEIPNLGDVNALSRSSKKIHNMLVKNKII